MSGKNPREISSLPTLQRATHEEIGGASARRDATWWCWFDHGSSERRLLGTKVQTVGKVDSNGLLGL